MKELLKIGFGNAKLSRTIANLAIPAGHTCPFAKECLSKVDKVTGRIQDGLHCKYRCYAASQECTYKTVRNARWYNLDLLNNCKSTIQMVNLIIDSLPKTDDYDKFRIHTAGDFFNEKYFLAWLNVSILKPEKIFYGYTKAIPFVLKYKRDMPKNFKITCSFGGTHDHLITEKIKSVKVMFSMDEATKSGLEIDHDDSHCYSNSNKSFASQSMSKLVEEGWNGYGPGKRNKVISIPVTSLPIKSMNFVQIKPNHYRKIYA